MNQNLKTIIDNYKSDKEAVYNTWFVNNEERLKAFRSIKRGVQQVIQDINCNGSGHGKYRISGRIVLK